MYSKFFFERLWGSEQKNELFVCMPFHLVFDSRFNDIIIPAAKSAGFDNAVRVKEDTAANVIISKIWDGIANSKMVLVDFTDDPKYDNHVNGNVLYEAGVAHSMREPSAVIMIRDQNPEAVDFDVKGLTIIQPPEGKLSKSWLENLLQQPLNNHNWAESKRVRAAAESIDDIGLELIWTRGRYPKGWNHFNTLGLPAELKISVLRLLDLGILWFATGGAENPTEHAYHWTPFGYEVMKFLCVKPVAMEEFEKMPEYEQAKVANEQYQEYRKKLKLDLKKK